MASRSITIQTIARVGNTVRIRHSRDEKEIQGGVTELRQWARDVVKESDIEDVLLAIRILSILEAQPNGSTLAASLEGKTLTIDTQANWTLANAVIRST